MTIGIIILACLAFLIGGEGPLDMSPQTSRSFLFEAFLNVFRHGSWGHLLGNIVLLGWGGYLLESAYGSRVALGLAIVAGLLGTALQFYIVDGNFLGISGIGYCFVICGVMVNADHVFAGIFLLGGLVFVGIEILFISDTIAAYAHLGGVITGGGWSMFEKLFGKNKGDNDGQGSRQGQARGNVAPQDPNQPYLAPLKTSEISRIVDIIDETDDDDAADASEALRERGCDHMYALWHQNRIVGVTGYAPTEARNDTAWLSWTYLEHQARGKELGRFMFEEILRIMNGDKIRKIFIATSDYMEDGDDVYADARKLYEKMGAKLEVTLPKFYSEDESKLIYGLVNPGMGEVESLDELGERGVRMTGIELDEDSDDIGAITWEEADFGVEGAERVQGLANSNKYRLCFLAIPADMSDVVTVQLKDEGYERIGTLDDYYAEGLGQVWWCLKLT